MKKTKRIIALSGVILLIGLYLGAFILALINTEKALQLFRAAVALTIIVPILAYAFILIYRVLSGGRDQ